MPVTKVLQRVPRPTCICHPYLLRVAMVSFLSSVKHAFQPKPAILKAGGPPKPLRLDSKGARHLAGLRSQERRLHDITPSEVDDGRDPAAPSGLPPARGNGRGGVPWGAARRWPARAGETLPHRCRQLRHASRLPPFTVADGLPVKFGNPPLVLLDPQLQNNAQSKSALHPSRLEKYSPPSSGVALTLGQKSHATRSLVGIPKNRGLSVPDLVHLKLGLTETDGVEGNAPQTSGPFKGVLEYHNDIGLYEAGMRLR